MTKEGISADRCGAVSQETSIWFSAEGTGYLREPGGQPAGPTCREAGYARDTFGENAPLILGVVAEEATGTQTETDSNVAPGKISQSPDILAVDTSDG